MIPRRDDPERARVEQRQVPVFGRTGQAFCAGIGLPWVEAKRLWDDGWLSFDPEEPGCLDESHEAELRFLGALVLSGCSPATLGALLRDLPKPYCYDLGRIFFDWLAQRWRLLPGEDDPEGCFFALLERLRDRDENEVLLDIRAWVDGALDLAGERTSLFAHEDASARRPHAGP